MALSVLREMSEINKSLYVSGEAAVTIDNINRYGITNVINLTRDVPVLSAKGLETMKIRIDDAPYANLSKHFDTCADLINRVALQGGKTLVHCVAGVSRSVTICLVYLMKYCGLTLAKAFDFMKRRRFIINPNYGFWQQLINYERNLLGHNSVHLVFTDHGWQPDIYIRETNYHKREEATVDPYKRHWPAVMAPGSTSSQRLSSTSANNSTHSIKPQYRGSLSMESVSPSMDFAHRGYQFNWGYQSNENTQFQTVPNSHAHSPYESRSSATKQGSYSPMRFRNSDHQSVSLPQRFLDKHTVYMNPNMF